MASVHSLSITRQHSSTAMRAQSTVGGQLGVKGLVEGGEICTIIIIRCIKLFGTLGASEKGLGRCRRPSWRKRIHGKDSPFLVMISSSYCIVVGLLLIKLCHQQRNHQRPLQFLTLQLFRTQFSNQRYERLWIGTYYIRLITLMENRDDRQTATRPRKVISNRLLSRPYTPPVTITMMKFWVGLTFSMMKFWVGHTFSRGKFWQIPHAIS